MQLISLNSADIEADRGVQMSNATPSSSDFQATIPAEIAKWLESETAAPAEFIIQADLPGRTVAVSNSATRQFESVSGMNADRQVRLFSLAAAIRDIILTEPSVLKAAGAIAVLALPEQLRRISRLPGIREIRFNRKLRS